MRWHMRRHRAPSPHFALCTARGFARACKHALRPGSSREHKPSSKVGNMQARAHAHACVPRPRRPPHPAYPRAPPSTA